MALKVDHEMFENEAMETNMNFDKITNRTAIKISFDQDFDDIYNKRFRKYCLLLAKEKELLRRMGKVRKLRSTTLGQNEIHESVSDDEEPLKRPVLVERRSTSLKEKRNLRLPLDFKEVRKLSVSYEELDHDFGSDSEEPQSNHERLTRPRGSAPSFHYTDTNELNPRQGSLSHSHSCEGISSTEARRSEFHTKMESFDEKDVTEMMERITKAKIPTVQAKRPMLSNLQKYGKNSLLTSSYRNLTDKNVREISKKESKTLRSPSACLERRLAEAKARQSKRGQVLQSLNDDFDKAKEIMMKYKSHENLLKTQFTDNILRSDLSTSNNELTVNDVRRRSLSSVD